MAEKNGFSERMGLRIAGVFAGFVILALVVVGIHAFKGSSETVAQSPVASPSTTAGGPSGSPTPTVISVPSIAPAVLAALPRSTTFTTVRGLPSSATATSGGNVVRIASDQPAFASPGGKPLTVIPKTQLGLDTWLPVVDRRSGWLEVRLPSRPNASVAWIPEKDLRTARTDWRVQVSLARGTMTVTQGSVAKGTWTVGHGQSANPTPVGQTFLLAGFVDPTQNFSPVIYALGAHSETLDSFGGGPGTVAVHGWPTAQGRRGRVSHGCVRVPSAALAMFAKRFRG